MGMKIIEDWFPAASDIEPIREDDIILRVQLTALHADDVLSVEGLELPAGVTHIRLVEQPNGNYGLQLIWD